MRKKNSILNIISMLGAYGFAILFNFITQAVFIKTLGVEYLGVNGLFTNILTMLSVAELGVGTTIIYKLYKPLAENNQEEIKSWMQFYQKCYNMIALIILILGISIIPFLEKIVGEVTIKENLILLYMIQILDTVFSYCLTYKRSLLYADQKNFIINLVHMGYIILMNITQILILTILHNYILYLITKVIYRILENIIINLIVNKKYPYILKKAKKLEKVEIRDVVERVKAILLQKISFVINKGIDNIVISYFLGVIAVGYYTNYYTIISAVSTIIFQVMSAVIASVGNLLVEENYEKNYEVYKKLNMINSFLTGICIVLTMCLMEPFIKLWIGEEYILSVGILFSFGVYLYSDSIRRAITIFKDAAGICKEDKHMYILMALINLVFSVILCKYMGTLGVILGTAISYLFLIIFSYPKYIFIKVFQVERRKYYIENLKYAIFIIFSTALSYRLCHYVVIDNNMWQLVVNIMISCIITFVMFFIMFGKTKEFNEFGIYISEFINKIRLNKGSE